MGNGISKAEYHSPEKNGKIIMDLVRGNKNTLENFFKQDLYPSEADLLEIAEDVKMSLSRVKASLENYRLVFEQKIGEEEFARRKEEGNFTGYVDERDLEK